MSALSSSVETGLGDLGAVLGYQGYRLGPTVPGPISDRPSWVAPERKVQADPFAG